MSEWQDWPASTEPIPDFFRTMDDIRAEWAAEVRRLIKDSARGRSLE